VTAQAYGAAPPVTRICVAYDEPTLALGSVAAVTHESGETGAGSTVNVKLLVTLAEAASVTVTAGVKLPEAVGVPETKPVEASIDSPPGNPTALKEYGVVPPLAVSGVAEYAVPTVAVGGVVTDADRGGSGAGSTVSAGLAVTLAEAASVTVTDGAKLPAVVGVPDSTPVATSIDMPSGRPAALKEYGMLPPLAVTGVAEYSSPTVAGGGVLAEADSGAGGGGVPVPVTEIWKLPSEA
jgi:hypothetical protein